MTVAWALTGFLLGAMIGALARRTVVTMGGTLFGLTGLWFAMNYVLRSWLITSTITPVRFSWPLTNLLTNALTVPPIMNTPDYSVAWELWVTNSGTATENMPTACVDPYFHGSTDMKQFVACMHQHGFVAGAVDYQPADRTIIFQSVELSVYVVLMLLFLGLTVRAVRRFARN